MAAASPQRLRVRLLVLAVAAGFFAVPGVRGDDAAAPAPLVVRVYHTNDVHGWIMARPSADPLDAGRIVGGAAALKAWIDKDAGPKLVLDAGDWWQGTPEGSLTKGEAVAEVFNAVGYDAVEIGNHEFDAGQDNLKSLIGKLKMPVLAANVYGPDGKRVPWTKPWIVKDVDGVKFGIFGLLTTHMDKLAFPKNIAGLAFRREVDEARDDVKELKRQGADVIIAVTHVGFEEEGKTKFEGDQTLAREVPGIDLIVGGHSHTFLSRAYRDPENGTLIVQAGCYLSRAGRTTFKIDPLTRRVLASSDELVELRPDRMGEDPAVKAIVTRRADEAGKAYEAVVATATAAVPRGGANAEWPLGSWMADCYRSWAAVDLAFQNGGGVRSDIPAGPVTLRRIFNVMPFDNALVKLRMTGAQLRALLDRGMGGPRLLQLSGARVEFVPGAPAGGRLSSVTVGGAPLDDAKTYSVVTLDFLVSGGDGFREFGAVPQEETDVLARDVLAQCAQKQANIAPPAPGRLRAKGGS
jgi:2',3'-cyclic-nucleotide 2'-phosphodiesterase (5'-nucleotidase family)